MLRLVATQPQLLADHVEAYAALVNDEMGDAVSAWTRRVLLSAVALGLLGVGAVLGGVALMFWAVMPALDVPAIWALLMVPAVPIAVSLLCLLACRRELPSAFADMKQQFAVDFAMLREVSSPEHASP